MAGALSRHMSGQMAGEPAAMRVMSLKPPAARRSRAVWASVASVARPMRVAAVRCGTCETTATRSSWRSGASATRSAPRLAMTDWTAEKAFGSVDEVGVSTQVEPANSSGSAPSGPSCSEPAIGCPPTKRGWVTSATIGPFTPPTSVTTSSPDSSARRRAFTSPAMAATGVATNATAAPWSTPISSMAPSSRARRARDSSRSRPVTRHPWARSARAIEVPTRPSPVTWARGATPVRAVRPAQSGRSSRSPRAPSR